YQCEINQGYPREQLSTDNSLLNKKAAQDRRTASGTSWDDPRTYLEEVLREAGRTPNDVEGFLPPAGKSRKAQAIADLTVYEEARRLFQELIARGRMDLETRL